MRYVVEKEMVAHLWAHQTQEHAKNSGGNFYFEGGDIYSYGSHFRCGSVVRNKVGDKAFLITTRSYSNTTAKHMNMVSGAIPFGSIRFDTTRKPSMKSGLLSKYDYRETLFYIVDQLKIVDESIKNQMKSRTTDYTSLVENAILNIGRWIKFWHLDKRQKSDRGEWLSPVIQKLLSAKADDKKYYWTISHGSYSINEIGLQKLLRIIHAAGLIQDTAVGGFEGRVSRLFIDWSGDNRIWEKFRERFDKQDEINRKARATRERNYEIRMEERRKEWAEADKIRKMPLEERIEKWRSGELASKWIELGYTQRHNAILRIRNGLIETSMGITIKPVEAIRLWPLIERFHKNETAFATDVVRDATDNIWHINSYKDDILTAGCHRLKYDEMKCCMNQLGIAV